MISKAKVKYIRSLEQKKYRRQEGVFVAEGPKVVGDILIDRRARLLVATHAWLQQNRSCSVACDELIEVDDETLRKLSFLQHPQEVLAVFDQWETGKTCVPDDELSLALDGVQDPGNLGTIIRIADWFGIRHIFCSMDTADVYNPKVVQATMGSIARVSVSYVDLLPLLSTLPQDFPVYGTLLDGDDLYQQPLQSRGLVVMGNEGNGISPAVAQHVNHRLFIPNYPKGRKTTDSLNVAIATAVVCAEFRRRNMME
ncbi:MAG: RNA methyltransferase [Prevotella sp.]|nr:RNA methyltransferase [Prevotella sp.]